MATRLENLNTALDNIAQQMADITANPLPNYAVDGQQVSWADMFQNLLDAQASLQEQISITEGPFDADVIGLT